MSRSIRWGALALLTSITPAIAHAQASAPIACEWVVRASSPVGMTMRGDDATFMLMGPSTMILLTGRQGSGSGSITLQGLGGTGTYPVGALAGGSGAIFTLQDQNGQPIALASGDGSPLDPSGKTPGTLPPPAQLAIQSIDSTHMRADLTGTFYRIDGATLVPPRLVLVPVHITFTAAPVNPSLVARPCK